MKQLPESLATQRAWTLDALMASAMVSWPGGPHTMYSIHNLHVNYTLGYIEYVMVLIYFIYPRYSTYVIRYVAHIAKPPSARLTLCAEASDLCPRDYELGTYGLARLCIYDRHGRLTGPNSAFFEAKKIQKSVEQAGVSVCFSEKR